MLYSILAYYFVTICLPFIQANTKARRSSGSTATGRDIRPEPATTHHRTRQLLPPPPRNAHTPSSPRTRHLQVLRHVHHDRHQRQLRCPSHRGSHRREQPPQPDSQLPRLRLHCGLRHRDDPQDDRPGHGGPRGLLLQGHLELPGLCCGQLRRLLVLL